MQFFILLSHWKKTIGLLASYPNPSDDWEKLPINFIIDLRSNTTSFWSNTKATKPARHNRLESVRCPISILPRLKDHFSNGTQQTKLGHSLSIPQLTTPAFPKKLFFRLDFSLLTSVTSLRIHHLKLLSKWAIPYSASQFPISRTSRKIHIISS